MWKKKNPGTYKSLFVLQGSAIYSLGTLPQCAVAAILTVAAKAYQAYNPFYQVKEAAMFFRGFSIVSVFVILFRAQLAYGRYWEAASSLQKLLSKLEDVSVHAATFVRGDSGVKALWRYRMGHLLTAYLAVMLTSLKLHCRGLSDKSKRYISFNKYPSGINSEMLFSDWMLRLDMKRVQALRMTTNPVSLMAEWVVTEWAEASLKGYVVVPDPIKTRTILNMMEITENYKNVKKIAETPFPFPYMQLCGFVVHLYIACVPISIAVMCPSYAVALFVSVTTILLLISLNTACAEIEDPFGDDSCDLPLFDLIEHFQKSVDGLGILQLPARERWCQLREATRIMSSQIFDCPFPTQVRGNFAIPLSISSQSSCRSSSARFSTLADTMHLFSSSFHGAVRSISFKHPRRKSTNVTRQPLSPQALNHALGALTNGRNSTPGSGHGRLITNALAIRGNLYGMSGQCSPSMQRGSHVADGVYALDMDASISGGSDRGSRLYPHELLPVEIDWEKVGKLWRMRTVQAPFLNWKPITASLTRSGLAHCFLDQEMSTEQYESFNLQAFTMELFHR